MGKNKKIKKPSQKSEGSNNGVNDSLQDICQRVSILSNYYKNGLHALKKGDRDKIKFPDTRKIVGSIDFDKALEASYPNENRWDYGIDYDKILILIEVHPAQTSEINVIIDKANFTRNWLKDNCSGIFSLPKLEKGERQFYWVASGGNGIIPNSRQAKRLAINHIKPVGSVFDYAKIISNQ